MRFMIIGLPRSMTTWAANWLSEPGFTVVHDPLYRAHYSQWAERFDAVSCTGIWRWPDWVNQQPCKKLVLRRDENEVRVSLARLGLQELASMTNAGAALDKIAGPDVRHINSNDLLSHEVARNIWRWLREDDRFDRVRHDEMVRCHVEPRLSFVANADKTLLSRLLLELQSNQFA